MPGHWSGSTRHRWAKGSRPTACSVSCVACVLTVSWSTPISALRRRSLAARLTVDVADYLPYDLPEHVDRLLGALQPDLLVFAKLDLWPELATRASTTGTEVAIVAATVSPGSGRLRWPARRLLAPGYKAVRAAAAVSAEDATRLVRLGVPAERIRVLGDPRFDSVLERVGVVKPVRSPAGLRARRADHGGGLHLAQRRGRAPPCLRRGPEPAPGRPPHPRATRAHRGPPGRHRGRGGQSGPSSGRCA